MPSRETTHGPVKGTAAFVLKKDDLWLGKKELKVRFMSDIPVWRDENNRLITEDVILKIANEWHQCGLNVVPKFVECIGGEASDIRVQFIGKHHLR